ncbi:MAG: hypothetical protein AVDCRST_MAG64-3385, partial [uncultured Phycisphaerae bacterium]
ARLPSSPSRVRAGARHARGRPRLDVVAGPQGPARVARGRAPVAGSVRAVRVRPPRHGPAGGRLATTVPRVRARAEPVVL